MEQLSFGPAMIFPKAVALVFDLRLESDEVLVLRNDSITVRADSDVRLAGPLNAAAATGTIYVTHSRFFKEIDILPIGLPGCPARAEIRADSGQCLVSESAAARLEIRCRDQDA